MLPHSTVANGVPLGLADLPISVLDHLLEDLHVLLRVKPRFVVLVLVLIQAFYPQAEVFLNLIEQLLLFALILLHLLENPIQAFSFAIDVVPLWHCVILVIYAQVRDLVPEVHERLSQLGYLLLVLVASLLQGLSVDHFDLGHHVQDHLFQVLVHANWILVEVYLSQVRQLVQGLDGLHREDFVVREVQNCQVWCKLLDFFEV
jgi:hypothetical protein